ncbi:MAG: alpha-L-fucosidase [Candidatus Brocadiia bacterium]
MPETTSWFQNARYGLFIHYGLYSLLGRGEWVMNKEQIPPGEYAKLAEEFTAGNFDVDRLLHRASEWGMRYAVLTCKHHDGFCLYDSELTDFTAPQTSCGRDLVAEFVNACRRHGLKVGLYHSLNDWSARPNAGDALDNPDECYQPFIDYVHGQIREIMSRYGTIDIMWYDGWWPFGAEGWQAEKLNVMVRDLQPHILLNDRTGLEGDFRTPEQHISPDEGMWEACMTLNDNWGYHRGDTNWKSPREVAEMLRKAAAGAGNLLLNVGPRGDGTLPEPSVAILDKVGEWLEDNGEAIFDSDRFQFQTGTGDTGRADWTHHGNFSARGDNFYLHIRSWPGETLVLSGLRCTVEEVTRLDTGETFPFQQKDGRLTVKDLPEQIEADMPVVMRFRTEDEPRIYKCGGLQVPEVKHCRYDPV